MLLQLRIALILGISISTLLISLMLDAVFAPLPGPLQFVIQIPLLVLAISALRDWIAPHAIRAGISNDQVDSSFFFAAPLAALGSRSLFADIRRLL
jgi:hypothetical protein